jgi:Tfp pilus assembly protein PilF
MKTERTAGADVAFEELRKAIESDSTDAATAGVHALYLLGEFLSQQRRTADALERIAAALEAPEAK